MRKGVVLLIISWLLVSGCGERILYDAETKFVAEIPVFEPPHAVFSNTDSLIVSIRTQTAGAVIRYTLDGSKPNASSPIYEGSLTISRSKTVKAIAIKQGLNDSAIASAGYVKAGIPMVYVEGGEFRFTADYRVRLSSFFMAKHEVTQSEYQSVMGSNPANFKGNPEHPVEMVSWFNAIEFCNRLSILEGLEPSYSFGDYGRNPDDWPRSWNTDYFHHNLISCDWSANGYRLPTIAEWMFSFWGGTPAQQAGTFYTDFSGSNNINDVGWYNGNSQGSTQPVGTKMPNELGIYDMTGNVWEWVWDRSGSLPKGLHTNPKGAKSGFYRIIEGGGWMNSAQHIKESYYVGFPHMKDRALGFRVCRNLGL